MSHDLTPSKLKELDDYWHNKPVRACPTCESTNMVIPVSRGKPSNDLIEYSKLGRIKLGSCTKSYGGFCTFCKKYVEASDKGTTIT